MRHKINITLSILLFVSGILIWNYGAHRPAEGFSSLGYGIAALVFMGLGLICAVASLIYQAIEK